jgi:hypothetical protein
MHALRYPRSSGGVQPRCSAITIPIAAAAICAALSGAQPLRAQDAPIPATIEELLQIWRDRGDKVQTLHAVMKVDQWIAKGSQMGPDDAERDQPYPADDTSLELEVEFWMDDSRWRMDQRGLKWHQPAGRFIDQHYVELVDQDSRLTYFGKPEAVNDAYPRAFVRTLNGPMSSGPSVGAPGSLPWLLAYRNDHDSFQGLRASDCRIAAETSVVDGRECYAVELVPPPGIPAFQRHWIDPALGHAIVRREGGSNDHVSYQLDIQYRHDPDYGWAPVEWEIVYQSETVDGGTRLRESARYVVEAVDFNKDLKGNPFTFQVATGTWVDDQTRGDEVAMYLVKDDQSERPITKQELARDITYEDLRTTASGEAGRPERRDVPWSWPIAGASLLLLLIGVWLMRRRA